MRYLREKILADVRKKMVFLAGPRQVGKTTLAQSLLADDRHYLNWDAPEDRERILKREWPLEQGLLVLDEIHKYRNWRSELKGLFDKQKKKLNILVTGSAKLDFYRFGGDSLQGRYYLWHLNPLSLAELKGNQDTLEDLLQYGGFPEPFFAQSQVESNRWSRAYRTRLIREDIMSLENVTDVGKLELLYLRLPDLVGSPLSLNALREDLQVHHSTVAKWVEFFERSYALFRLPPWGSARIKSVKKEQKHYHLDWTLVEKPGARFENLVAVHLLKWVQWNQDAFGHDWNLGFFREPTGREVDFVVSDSKKPLLFVEVKLDDDAINPALKNLKNKFPETPAYQVSFSGKKDFTSPEGIRVCPARLVLDQWV